MKSTIELTFSARAEVERHGLWQRVAAMHLGASAMRGDVVELATPSGSVLFVIRARRHLLAADGSHSLELELDFPARPSR